MVGYCLRQFLMDSLTLDEYEKETPVSWESIERRLVLNERKINYHITDNQLRLALDSYELNSLEELFLKGLPQLSSEFLEYRNNSLYVKSNMFSKWQELITFCPPLVLVAAFASNNNINVDYIQNTALLPPYIKELEDIKEHEHGFNDLHIHLNGSTEVDVLWQDILLRPELLINAFDKSLERKKLVREQIEQELIIRNSNHLAELLSRARALRYYLIKQYLTKSEAILCYPSTPTIRDQYVVYLDPVIHPYQSIDRNNTTLNSELRMYVKLYTIIGEVDIEERDNLLRALHHYLLILGTLNRFVVHQLHQNGFQQFQKINENSFRQGYEKNYASRFFQLKGNEEGSNFKIIEGRFAPKEGIKENKRLINDIRKGWFEFKKEESNKNQELRLICHFIKRKVDIDDGYFHEKLRTDLLAQARKILKLKGDNAYETEDLANNFNKLVSIDASSSEFDTPPEVFAQIFRLLRAQNAVTNYTYHVGEDFIHIISGLRAIFEAMDFLEMKDGDRLGHATALGVCPRLWKERIGDSVYISRSEWLDNLLFIYDFLKLKSGKQLEMIKKQINKLSRYLYPKIRPSINDLIIAWKFRRWDPTLFFADSVSSILLDLQEEYYLIKKTKLTNTQKMLVEYYFRNHNNKRENEKILVDFEMIDLEILREVQLKLSKYIKEQGIIIEILPTSNVRIGIYNNYKEHHLKSWIDPSNMPNNQKVVVGSDDTGIFATNIYNEFAHIYLMYSDKNTDIINELVQNSEQAKSPSIK